MPDNKNFDTAEFLNGLNNEPYNPSFFNELFWVALMFMPFLFGNNFSNSESFLKGKIEAYENVLKGFDCNER